MIKIETITPGLAEALCRKITADLPEYFGLPEVNEHYAMGGRSKINLALHPASRNHGFERTSTFSGNSYPLDDDLVLWFTKKIKKESYE